MSFSSPPERPEIELVVERLADGEVSPYLTDVLRAGDLLVDDLIGRDELDHQPATVEVNLTLTRGSSPHATLVLSGTSLTATSGTASWHPDPVPSHEAVERVVATAAGLGHQL